MPWIFIRKRPPDSKHRNEQAARRIISEGKKHNSKGHFTFIQKDVTLLKNVDEVCSEIKSREQKLNLLFMTSGTMSLKGRDGMRTDPWPSPYTQLTTRPPPRNLRRPRQKTNNKLLRPPSLHNPTPPPPPRLGPPPLARGVRARPRRRNQILQPERPRPKAKLHPPQRRQPRHHHDGLRLRGARPAARDRLFRARIPRDGKNRIHERNRRAGASRGKAGHAAAFAVYDQY